MEPLAISALVHHTYCPRKCALVWVDGVWADNIYTTKGQRNHRRVNSGDDREERGRHMLRNLEVWSDRHGLIGRCDAVEVTPDSVHPVEYKSGRAHEGALIQLCAQALCLEEMFTINIESGAIWSQRTRRRTNVVFDQALRDLTLQTIAATKATLASDRLPPPTHDHRCSECQHLGHCLPELGSSMHGVSTYMSEFVFGEEP